MPATSATPNHRAHLVQLLLLLWLCGGACALSWPGCRLSSDTLSGLSQDGELYLGTLLSIHMDVKYPEVTYRERPAAILCEKFHIRYYRYLLAIIFAVAEINNSSSLLPNITLGFHIYDTCYNTAKSLLAAMQLLSGVSASAANFDCNRRAMPSAIIGDMPSKASMPVARILGVHRYPQISYASAHPQLSDKRDFPSFLRTIPNDNYEVMALAELARYFNWSWVGIITSGNELGASGSQLLTQEITKNGGCVAFVEALPLQNSKKEITRIVNFIKESRAKAILVYTTMENLIPFMEEASNQNITDKVWIGCGSWSIASDFPNKEILTTLNGSLGVAPESGRIPGFREFLYSVHPSGNMVDRYTKLFWETAFGCKWVDAGDINSTEDNFDGTRRCSGREKVESIDSEIYDVYNFRYTYKVYNAVYAVAHALHAMNSCVQAQGPFPNGSCAEIHNHQHWQLLHYIKHVRFKNSAGEEIFFDKNGDVPLFVDVLNWQMFPNGSGRYVHIGKYDARLPKGEELVIDESRIRWNGGQSKAPESVCSSTCPEGHRSATREGEPKCCFDCVPCSEGEIINVADRSQCIKCPQDQWPNWRKDQCLPKPIHFLSYQEFLGSSLAAAAITFFLLTACILGLFLKNRSTPIVKANNRGLSYLLLISLMLCFLSSLMFIGRPMRVTCMLRQVVFGIIFSICLSVILAKTMTVVLAFSITNPVSKLRRLVGFRIPVYIIPSCTLVQVVLCIVWMASASPFSDFNMEAELGTIIIECNEGSNVFFSCVLGYMGLLASVSLLVAFMARKLPDTFNEAKFITFSMLVFASVWLTFIPAYLSTKGKFMVAVEIFAILSSSSGLLVCIFLPKCYVIVMKPEMNMRKHITGKSSTKKSCP